MGAAAVRSLGASHRADRRSEGERGVSREVAKGAFMSVDRLELPQGTLDLLILKTVALGPRHGWAISERLHQISSATLTIRQGSLYPALHRLERRGWIKAHWGASENNRRGEEYQLTTRRRGAPENQNFALRQVGAGGAPGAGKGLVV